jgi:hypothetical protein
MKMSLGSSRKNVDPAAEASMKGKAPTLGEVQKSLKVRIEQYLVLMVSTCTDCMRADFFSPF